ncbi:hypothetical protein Btru_030884 [Bulinus truncatus]|nr:hypothetical protein Btru_030884 [Bulinus truncatus]
MSVGKPGSHASSKRRGLPHLTEEERAERKKQLSANSEGIGGIRRNAHKRKKARLFDKYEELDDSEEDNEPPFVDSPKKDSDITLHLGVKKKKKL